MAARLFFLAFLALPMGAYANAGLPMLAIVWPMSVPAFIPVVAIESWVVRRELNVSWRVAITEMLKGNIVSTLVGIPLAWGASVAIEFLLAYLAMAAGAESYPPHVVGEVGRIVLSAPWLGPFEKGGHWIIPLAMIVLLVPFFFASFWTEAWYVSQNLCPETPAKARPALWKANAYSYIGLFAASVAWLVFGVVTHA